MNLHTEFDELLDEFARHLTAELTEKVLERNNLFGLAPDYQERINKRRREQRRRRREERWRADTS